MGIHDHPLTRGIASIISVQLGFPEERKIKEERERERDEGHDCHIIHVPCTEHEQSSYNIIKQLASKMDLATKRA